MAVNKGRVRLLVDALRSGEYEQCHGALHKITENPDGTERHTWCCLGVAADVACRNGLQVSRRRTRTGDSEVIDHTDALLGSHVALWYGFSSTNPRLLDPASKQDHVATHFNDSLGLTLPQIGDLFETTYLAEEDS